MISKVQNRKHTNKYTTHAWHPNKHFQHHWLSGTQFVQQVLLSSVDEHFEQWWCLGGFICIRAIYMYISRMQYTLFDLSFFFQLGFIIVSKCTQFGINNSILFICLFVYFYSVGLTYNYILLLSTFPNISITSQKHFFSVCCKGKKAGQIIQQCFANLSKFFID